MTENIIKSEVNGLSGAYPSMQLGADAAAYRAGLRGWSVRQGN